MNGNFCDLPGDFAPVEGCVPDWIDIQGVCGESRRFVGIYSVSGFNLVAINNGRNIFTTSDRGGEFRTRLARAAARSEAALSPSSSGGDDILIYDCQEDRQWIAPRDAAVEFLYRQN